jgi:hypothetical protein
LRAAIRQSASVFHSAQSFCSPWNGAAYSTTLIDLIVEDQDSAALVSATVRQRLPPPS